MGLLISLFKRSHEDPWAAELEWRIQRDEDLQSFGQLQRPKERRERCMMEMNDAERNQPAPYARTGARRKLNWRLLEGGEERSWIGD